MPQIRNIESSKARNAVRLRYTGCSFSQPVPLRVHFRPTPAHHARVAIGMHHNKFTRKCPKRTVNMIKIRMVKTVIPHAYHRVFSIFIFKR